MAFRSYISLSIQSRNMFRNQLLSELFTHHWSVQCRPPTCRRTIGSLAWQSRHLSACKQALSLKTSTENSNRLLSTQVPQPHVDPELSYAFGRSNNHLLYSTIGQEFDKQLKDRPDEVAFISHNERIKATYRQFNEDLNRLLKAMVVKLNIKRGDFVGLWAYNCYNWLLVQYACSRLGAILTPINPSYKVDELAFMIKRGKIKCLFMPGPRSEQAKLNDHMSVLKSSTISNLFTEADGCKPLLENVVFMDREHEYSTDVLNRELKLGKWCQFHNWLSITQSTDGRVFRSPKEVAAANLKLEDAFILDPNLVSPDDLFAVYYTSGTTGTPKGACITQFNVLNNVRICQLRLRNGGTRNLKMITATTLPLFHIFAGVLSALAPAVERSTVVFVGHKYDVKAYVEAIIEHQATCTTLTPTMLIDLVTHVEQNNYPDLPLRIVQPGGAPLAPEVVKRTFKVLPHLEEMRTGYGSTENGAVATMQTSHESEGSRSRTVGSPLDFTEVRIVNLDDGYTLVPLGERGEVQTRGFNTMVGYLDQPDRTREVITPNRWYRTGDIGVMNTDGSIEITGRLKHMIIRGGENIYPEEVEKAMLKLGCIEKVHVVGVPDERYGEQVCAWVKLKSGYKGSGGDHEESLPEASRVPNAIEVTKDSILKFCKENMTYFKVPKYVFFVQDFPMTPTKKVQNHIMVTRSAEILNLTDIQSVRSNCL